MKKNVKRFVAMVLASVLIVGGSAAIVPPVNVEAAGVVSPFAKRAACVATRQHMKNAIRIYNYGQLVSVICVNCGCN